MSFIYSNEVFKGDLDILDSLDSEASRRFFVGFSEEKPTLEMALREANIKNHDIILQDSRRFAGAAKKNPEIAKLGLSDNEAGAISCYTLQGNGEGKSPYQIINEGLVGSRNRAGLALTGRLLFLLLSGLRKLPRTRPSAGQIFYRGIRVKVPRTRGEATKMDGNGMVVTHQFYEEGRTVTWWGFTSTSTNLKAAYDFIQGVAASTVFHVGGEDLWGYDIKAFSKFVSEDEVLLEPEAKVRVGGAVDSGTLLTILVTLEPFKHLVLEDIIPVGNASSVPIQIGQPPNTKKKWDCAWKECPPYVNQMVRYSIDPYNPRVAAKMVPGDNCYCTIIGDAFVPLNTVKSWSVKVLSSRENNGHNIFVGVAPSDINQNGYDYNTMCGWYLHCRDSTLWSGPPHNYRGKMYTYKTMNFSKHMNVGVLMDTEKRKLSFALNEVILDVAYKEIPLNKPLVPCVLLWKYGDSVELDIPETTVPSNLVIKNVTHGSITLTWDEVSDVSYEVEMDGNKSMKLSSTNTFTKRGLLPETEYSFRVRAVRGSSVSEWSGAVKGRTLKKTYGCVWKECPDDVDLKRKYSVDGENPRVATKVNSSGFCTIIGNTHIPLGTVTSWSIKILESEDNDGDDIYIGIAPFDINQNVGNYNKCGWYFDCYYSTLSSGPPHKYNGKEYGPRKGGGQHVHTVGVVMDTKKGDLSFVLNGANYGAAYEGIPLDKPLVPCVLLKYEDDSAEFVISDVKENVDSSIPVPSNIVSKSGSTRDTLTLTWDEVADASFYQIEVDGSKSWDATTANTFTLRGLLPETEHSFRVRTVRGSSVSEWSSVVKGRTLKESFESSWWKECPDDVDFKKKYRVDGRNPRIATKVYDSSHCTIIGNTSIPLNKATSWSIKILKSKDNNGNGIYIGIAPLDINQNNDNYNKCGWYFSCYSSTLCSGPPHEYSGKEYGPKKGDGQYVHDGDSVGVVMDTIKGDLSFVLNGVNYGLAYKGIPLDKPLVPCVLPYYEYDSVELDTFGVKENEVDSSVPVPSNIITKNVTWNLITLTWDEVSGASFYQIEVDGNMSWGATTANSLTKRRLFPETEHSFRVRTVRGNSVGEWSGTVKGRTLKAPEFPECVWKKCPDDVGKRLKYSVDWKNPKVATKINGNGYYCTTIGNTLIPLNTVTSWSIKILESEDNDGGNIYIGIAPPDINQNEDDNYMKCGWYFYCYDSSLYSGPPHSYKYPGKEYGPRKEDGQYVHTGDSVGVVMDTTKGDLSFVLNGVNCGAAYEGIPLDKPLVPCVLLYYPKDSVELII